MGFRLKNRMGVVQKSFTKGKVFARIISLFFLAIVAFVVDFFLFVFTSSCANCANFFQFLLSPASLTGPILVSLSVFFPRLTRLFKTFYTKR